MAFPALKLTGPLQNQYLDTLGHSFFSNEAFQEGEMEMMVLALGKEV